MHHFHVNGRFFGRPVTGVERFAEMLLAEIDRRIGAGELGSDSWTLHLPSGVAAPQQIRHMRICSPGKDGGHRWEQTSLRWASRNGILLNLCNSGPVLNARSLTVIHDAGPFDIPGDFARLYGFTHRQLGRLLALRGHLATVSRFSQQRLAAVLGLRPEAIAVIPNAADHLDRLVPDTAILARLGLAPGRYLLFVGSLKPNKNLPRALEAWRRAARPGERFVIIGAAGKAFADQGIDALPDGVVMPGRVADAELAALYQHARALVFPSLYEGFGIPAIEAIHFGNPVIAADIPPVREACGAAAIYHDPRSIEALADQMRAMIDDDALHTRLADAARAQRGTYGWRRSADLLLQALREIG